VFERIKHLAEQMFDWRVGADAAVRHPQVWLDN
jgi:hypothetical protein